MFQSHFDALIQIRSQLESPNWEPKKKINIGDTLDSGPFLSSPNFSISFLISSTKLT